MPMMKPVALIQLLLWENGRSLCCHLSTPGKSLTRAKPSALVAHLPPFQMNSRLRVAMDRLPTPGALLLTTFRQISREPMPQPIRLRMGCHKPRPSGAMRATVPAISTQRNPRERGRSLLPTLPHRLLCARILLCSWMKMGWLRLLLKTWMQALQMIVQAGWPALPCQKRILTVLISAPIL